MTALGVELLEDNLGVHFANHERVTLCIDGNLLDHARFSGAVDGYYPIAGLGILQLL